MPRSKLPHVPSYPALPYFVYKVLTNRIRALIIAAGYIPDRCHHVITIRILEMNSPSWCTTCTVCHSSGVAKLGHTGARALATGGCAPPAPVQALLKIIGAECTVINRELGAKSAQRC